MLRPKSKRSFGVLAQRPVEVIRATGESVRQADPCALITTKANREFLAILEGEYGVTRMGIRTVIRDTYDQDAVALESFDAKGGPEPTNRGGRNHQGILEGNQGTRKTPDRGTP